MNTRIGMRIRTLRTGKGISQEEMADKLHISQSAYSRIENGESNNWINLIEKLCRVLDVKPEELFASEGLVQNNHENASAVQNHTQHDTHITINHLSDKVIELYEEKIKRLEAEIEWLKKNN
ncbi:MAG: helix-turn-helix transcriptional regulator [Candidatus Azobacteroides sp.]|nr:helix-turn-helix transcriptional regulator [Candidatus Azobacteroides sp.]